MALGTGIIRDQTTNERPRVAENGSPGMEIEIFWGIWTDFGPEKRGYRGEALGGVRGGCRSGDEVVGGGYGEEIAGCGEVRFVGGRRLAGSRDRSGDQAVVGEARAGSGGCGRRLVEGCRNSGNRAKSEDPKKPGESAVTVSEEKLRWRFGSKLVGSVVTVAAGRHSVVRGQPESCGWRPKAIGGVMAKSVEDHAAVMGSG